MSFSIPHTAPNFSSTNRGQESSNWLSRGGRNDELPLYKDKPYGVNYYGSSHFPPWVRRRRNVIKNFFIFIAISLTFYGIYLTGTKFSDSGEVDYDRRTTLRDRMTEGKFMTNKQKAELIRETFRYSWDSYKEHAWGLDVYKPISSTGSNMCKDQSGLGWFIVDSLDTMMLMGLEHELKDARQWVAHNLTYKLDCEVNTFEVTIRMLGGLLSAFYLSKDDIYLEKATDLGNRLIGAFDSPTGVPYASVNLESGAGVRSHADRGASSTAEAATLQLEFRYLAKLTGEELYWKAAEKVISVIEQNHAEGGLVPIFIDPETGHFYGNNIRLGSRGDSYYEYLLKMYLQTDKTEGIYRDMYDEAIAGVRAHLVQKSAPKGFTFIGELPNGMGGGLSPKMDHLVCFMAGQLALGATEGVPLGTRGEASLNERQKADLDLGKEIARTCFEMYDHNPSGLAAEITYFNFGPGANEPGKEDLIVKARDAHNLQRPETVESLYILWKLTGDRIYREWGWEIFKSFDHWTFVKPQEDDVHAIKKDMSLRGYTSIENVKIVPPPQRDNMESFWMAETLKYLYLLFQDEPEAYSNHILPGLDKFVFNTEAHPFPIFEPQPLFKTGWTRSGGPGGIISKAPEATTASSTSTDKGGK